MRRIGGIRRANFLERRSGPRRGVGGSQGTKFYEQAIYRQLNRPCPIPGMFVIQTDKGCFGVFPSASPRCLDGGDVDLLHRHHRLEGTLCLTATSGKRIG